MNNSNNDRYLHLEPIDKDQLVGSTAPRWINSKWIDTVYICHWDYLFLLCTFHPVTAAKDVQIHADEVVVDPPAVERKETHHDEDVSQLGDPCHRALLDLIIEKQKIYTKCENDSSVSDVTEHHSKEEGESDCSEDTRVKLLVARHSIGVNDHLRNNCVTVGVESSWRLDYLQLLYLWRRCNALYIDCQLLLLSAGQIYVSNQEMVPQLHLVETLINKLLLPKESTPSLNTVPMSQCFQQLCHSLLIKILELKGLFILVYAPPHLLLTLLTILQVYY